MFEFLELITPLEELVSWVIFLQIKTDGTPAVVGMEMLFFDSPLRKDSDSMPSRGKFGQWTA